MTNSLQAPASVIERLVREDPRLVSYHSQRQYIANLRDFEAWRKGRLMTKLLVESYVAHLQRRDLSASTINQKLASVRWWARKVIDVAFEYAPQAEAETVSRQAARVVTVANVRGEEEQIGRHLTLEERDALLAACGEGLAGIRNRAMLWLAWTNGVRVGTLASLMIQDLRRAHNQTIYIKYIGKGRKKGEIVLKNAAREAMLAWLAVRGKGPGPVFQPVKYKKVVERQEPMSNEALRKILDGIVAASGVEHLTWHYFRHTLLGTLIERHDIRVAQRVAGHSNPATTARYDWRPKQIVEDAIGELSQ